MEDRKSENTKHHVHIGIIGHGGYGKTDLMKAIDKTLLKKDIRKDRLFQDIRKEEFIQDIFQSDREVFQNVDNNAHKETDELKR